MIIRLVISIAVGGALLAVLSDLNKRTYAMGYVTSCTDTYTEWYKKLDVRDIDQESLKAFCTKKLVDKLGK